MLFAPSIVEAWGPITHVYLGYQVLEVGAALIPAGIYGIIKKYKNDFLYGNISADIILGRRFQGFDKNSHNWNMAWEIISSARDHSAKGICIRVSYASLWQIQLSTILSQTVFLLGIHSLRSGLTALLDSKYRGMLKMLDRSMQRKNDIFP